MNKDRQVLSIGVLGCGPIAQFAHFESCIKARNMRLYALCDQAPDLVERMDYQEGFHIYGEHGSVVGKTYLPWFLKSSDVECFSTRDGQYHRPLGADAHFYRLQLEGFADVVLHGAPQMGADVEDGTLAMRAMAAIVRSVASGDWVRLETVTGGV